LDLGIRAQFASKKHKRFARGGEGTFKGKKRQKNDDHHN
jgi:hypothetical protein